MQANNEDSIKSALALTASDSTLSPEGRMIQINCTVAGNVKLSLSDGTTTTLPVTVGLSVLPFGVVRVWSTGTTATATYTNLY